MIKPVTKNNMVFLAKAMLLQQKEFWMAGKLTAVNLAIHYMQAKNMKHIRSNGLLMMANHKARNIHSKYNGSMYWDRIYTANNVTSSLDYGDTRLIAVSLKGV